MRAWTLPVAVWALAVAGCGMFEELQSVEDASGGDDETASTGSTTGSADADSGSETAGAACEILADDRCLDQDTLQTCDPETGDITVYACGELCGENVNFTCLLSTSDGRHGCWCVAAGIDTLPCTELEVCLQECGDETCSDKCFSRSTENTIRIYGSLVHCANEACTPLCSQNPGSCGGCIASTIAEGTGDCAVPRSLCDNDVPEDPW